MVHVGMWTSLALLALCHSLRSEASVTIERQVEPTTIETAAAMSDSDPIWLVLPMLLDVQPVLLKVDVTRHVTAQIQSFCRDHGVDTTRCSGAIRECLDEVVNFQRFCKKPTAESALPGFAVTKHVLMDSMESTAASWLQNDPEDIAIDFCGFAQAKAAVEQTQQCVEALEKALRLSFDWMLALTPCEHHAEADSDVDVTASDSETQSIAERLATVEEMIAALQSSSDAAPSVTLEESADENVSVFFNGENDAVEEISVSADPIVAGESNDDIQEAAATVDELEGNAPQLLIPADSESTRSATKEGDADQDSAVTSTELDAIIETVAKRVSTAASSLREAPYMPLYDRELIRIDDKDPQKSWKVGAALVLALSILYLAVDFMIHCVHYVTGRLGAPKQLASVFLHDILLLLGGGTRSKLNRMYKGSDDLKKPNSRRSKVTSEGEFIQPKREVKRADKKPLDGSVKSQVTPHHSSPSFTCVAMMLSITSDAIALPHDAQTQPTACFVQDSNEALKIIQHKFQQEVTAAQRIQNAWKAAQRKVSLKQWGVFNASADKAPSLQVDTSARASRTEVASSLRRFLPNPLPPR